MKIEVEKQAASRLINCGELILVTAGYKDKTTITPCAWHMPISKSPAALGIALSKKHFSSELIKKSEEFAINIPDWSLLDRVIDCGKRSGREIDKFKKINLTKVKGCVISKAPLVDECIGNIECTLLDIKEVGDHFIFIGEIVKAQVKQEYFKEGFWDTSAVDLIFHLGGKFFFKSPNYSEVGK